MRVATKYKMNRLIAAQYTSPPKPPDTWVNDDVVYSVGEMLDRILIEHIKQSDFTAQNNFEKIKSSQAWQDRVLKYLSHKITLIREAGAYETVQEMRTY
jgi:hypothetical protein